MAPGKAELYPMHIYESDRHRSPHRRGRLTAAAGLLLCVAGAGAGPEQGTLALLVTEDGSAAPVACNLFLRDGSGRPVRLEGYPFWRDHSSLPGQAEFRLPPGEYSFSVERGPETLPSSGTVSVESGATRSLSVRLGRLANLAGEGWWSGETHIHRPPAEAELLVRASDLMAGQVITWWNTQNPWAEGTLPRPAVRSTEDGRTVNLLGGEDEREGGALLYFGLSRPLPIQEARRDYPLSTRYLSLARREPGAWVDAEKPFWWDLPLWLAAGVDTVGIAHNHMHRGGVYPGEAWGKPRDPARFPGPHGNGEWTQEIYARILDAGLRVPPSAGSASGVLPNPVGYNRVYAYVGGNGSYTAWSRSVRAGRSFVTNGPLLRVTAGGELPGTVFRARGRPLEVPLEASLISRDPVAEIQIVQNGQVVRRVPARPGSGRQSLGRVRFEASGWFLVRAVADVPHTYRFASTAPFWVEFPRAPRRISRSAVRFFQDWLEERAGRLVETDPALRGDGLARIETARRFWREQAAQANAE